MINLLPYEYKSEIRAGRTNIILIRYIAILICAAVVLGGLVTGTFFAISGTKTIAQDKVNQNQERAAAYQSVKVEADAFRTDLATAKTIMDSSVSFSKLIYEIADTIPPGVVLDELPLDPATFGTDMTMTASAKTFKDADKLEEAFKNNSQIFTSVKLQNVKSSSASSDSNNTYPVKVTLSVVINKGAIQ